ncbi:MAG: TRAP transporter small permease subunit [Pseudomonadota bacterium]
MLIRLSERWAKIELLAAALLAFAVTCLILLNVVTRTSGAALFWVDELAIYAMVWMTFLGASAAIHFGHSISITVLTGGLPDNLAKLSQQFVDVVVLVFALAMLWFCWIWFLPVDIARAGFDADAFQGDTFNFIYAEPTTTLGIRKWWVWLVMWLFAIGATLHAVANLFRPDRPRQVQA